MCKLVFGITGTTGTGKSTVSEFFRELGVKVFDADKIYGIIISKGSSCLAKLEETFGSDIILPNKELDRKKLGAIVFSDPDKLDLLNSITHSAIKEYIEKQLKLYPDKICAIDGAVLIGSIMESMCKFMVSVIAPPKTRLQRIMQRDCLTQHEALLRMSAQPADEFYRLHSKYIIHNDKDIENLKIQVQQIFNIILKEDIK